MVKLNSFNPTRHIFDIISFLVPPQVSSNLRLRLWYCTSSRKTVSFSFESDFCNAISQVHRDKLPLIICQPNSIPCQAVTPHVPVFKNRVPQHIAYSSAERYERTNWSCWCGRSTTVCFRLIILLIDFSLFLNNETSHKLVSLCLPLPVSAVT